MLPTQTPKLLKKASLSILASSQKPLTTASSKQALAIASLDDQATHLVDEKELIIRDGQPILTSEIESIIKKHRNVLDAKVVGAPDYRLGQVVAAYIKVSDSISGEGQKATVASIKEECKNKLAKFKVPKHWKILEEQASDDKAVLEERCVYDFQCYTMAPHAALWT